VVSKVTQGITSEIIGEDWTDAPANDAAVAASIIAGHPVVIPFDGRHAFRNWLTAIARHGVSTNVGAFVGGSSIRSYAKGMSSSAASSAEISTMQVLVQNAMEDGAFGVAPALAFAPASYFTRVELIDLARTMAPYGGFYAFHLRSEGDELLQSIDEVLDIGREGHVPVEIYHFKAAGRSNWTKAEAAIKRLNDARADGQDVGAFMYPYEARNGNLANCFPSWVSSGGGLLANLRDQQQRARIKREVSTHETKTENECLAADPRGSLVMAVNRSDDQEFVQKSLADIALAEGKD
jgi:dihydroorotase/N-acyl-D-amino-acid deacylase